MLTREQILAVPRATRTVAVEGWPGPVCVREMSLAERLVLEAKVKEIKGVRDADAFPLIVAATLCDGEGNLLFGFDDVGLLAGLPLDPLVRIAEAAREVNGLTQADVEELTGKSQASPTSDSPTGSRDTSG